MKTNYFLIVLIAIIFISCTEDNEDQSILLPQDLALQRVEKFTPSLAAYQSNLEGSYKNVTYYSNQLVVADTTFNVQGNVYSIVRHSYTNNVHTITYGDTGSLGTTKEYTYDSEDRLIKKIVIMPFPGNPEGPTSIEIYTYNADNTITRNAVDPSTNLVMPQYAVTYHVNSDGYISYIDYDSATSNIVYEGTKPIQCNTLYDGGYAPSVDFTYYDNPLPEIFQRNVNEINNSVFEDFEERIAENCNYYLKSYVNLVDFDKQFDAENYIQYCKATGVSHEEIYDSESFYYYE